jgi:hypothetical protein
MRQPAIAYLLPFSPSLHINPKQEKSFLCMKTFPKKKKKNHLQTVCEFAPFIPFVFFIVKTEELENPKKENSPT